MEEDQYLSVGKESQGLYKEKGSKFIAIAIPVDSLEEVKEQLENTRKTYHDARHHCYAYKIGKEEPEFRYNDDGEPSGTAGRPIFGQIESFGLTNVLIIVVRYFGGVKLGTGGLIQAYKSAARDALEQAPLLIKTLMTELEIKFPYLSMNDVMKIVKEENLTILKQDFSLDGNMILSVRRGRFLSVKEKFEHVEGVIFQQPLTS